MSMPLSGSNGFSLSPTLGATYIGTIFAAILFGVTNVQTYMYYKRNSSDSLLLRNLVFFLWILDGLHQAFITHAFYTYAVTDFSDPLALLAPEWSVMAHVFVASTSDAIVRGLFCQRVYKLSGRNWLITVVIAIATLVVLGSSWAFAIKGLSLPDYFDLSGITWFVYTSLISSVVADLLIASSLCILLSRRRSSFTRSNSVIRLLMIYAINTGALTTICAAICLIIYATMPATSKFAFIAIYFVLPKLLLNSLLGTLNARQGLRERTHTSGGLVSIPLSHPTSSGTRSSLRLGSKLEEHTNPGTIEIQIQTATDLKADSMGHLHEQDRMWHAV
ncbi:hypothetical protein WOLCODRAFT_163869 [Wolfiporia cocos MD-104 SS10]|uniref:DUF6534 domain-containing protein n=1 Tax=Wolfiporia cocos (strain MD-104) TaxID=742152 RepID=A0A2H3JXG8_WOLCO|nr:hypothetical protein WOLCODRAFT_163869 [Wolfiporia cocos MD-104 SS10]